MNARSDEKFSIRSECERVANSQFFSGFGSRNRCVDGEAIEMIEPLRICPFRQMLLAQLHEFLLKFRHGLPAVRIARGHQATLAGIMSGKQHRTDMKRLQ